ncbi:cytochrome P450 [Suillus paluster]|uniref:cytochrome P450 n=1 Tax=Suillus paluster TaxID=48578 RepID=UPI001B86D55E|nr:cytochrome P450 [Suillus paluster]KAG1742639.1 cytochrome P450 [Suillus paluster]
MTLKVSRHTVQSFVAAIVMEITYGYEMQSENDPYVSAIAELLAILEWGHSLERAAILLVFPFRMLTSIPSSAAEAVSRVAYIPTWFPGAHFTRDALYPRQLAQRVLNEPFNFTKSEIVTNLTSRNVAAMDEENHENRESVIKAAAATVFMGEGIGLFLPLGSNILLVVHTAGFETSSSMLHALILAMTLYPNVQAKAQVGIDTIQRISLAPAGACVILNVWAMSRDEEKYPDPDEFRPERHFAPDGSLLSDLIMNNPLFGLGRRIYPGRFAAESMAWAAIVSILATIGTEKARGVDGREIDVKKQFTTGMSMFVNGGISGLLIHILDILPLSAVHLYVVLQKRRIWSEKAPEQTLTG